MKNIQNFQKENYSHRYIFKSYLRRCLYISIILLFPQVALGENVDVKSEDEKMTDILSEISEKYQTYKNFILEFKYLRIDPDIEEPEEFEGKLIMEGDSKYRLYIKDREIRTNGKTKWIFVKSVNEKGKKAVEVVVSNYDPEDTDEKVLLRIRNTILYPTEWLTPVLYEKRGDIDIIELEPFEEDNQSEEDIENEEDNLNEEVSKIKGVVLEIKNETKELKSWRIETSDGVHQTYAIAKFEPNTKIEKKFFIFDKKKYEKYCKKHNIELIVTDIREDI